MHYKNDLEGHQFVGVIMMESFISNDGEQFIVLILTAIPTSPKFTISTLSYLAIWDIFYNDINQQRTMRYHKLKPKLKVM